MPLEPLPVPKGVSHTSGKRLLLFVAALSSTNAVPAEIRVVALVVKPAAPVLLRILPFAPLRRSVPPKICVEPVYISVAVRFSSPAPNL